jgi:small-conductance mechanosensitive channel
MQRAVRFGVLGLGFLWVLGIFNIQPATVLTVIGAFGLALGLAMQDTVKNVVAGLYLLVEGTFRIGDRVDMRGQSGWVEGTYLRHTALRTEAGRRVVIPNNLLMNEVIVNRTWYTGLEGGESVRVRVVQALDAYAPAGEAAEAGEEEQVVKLEVPRGLVAAITEVVRASACDLPGGLSSPSPVIVVESLAGGKLTLRLDVWTKQREEALIVLFDRLRQRLPSPDISVVE